MRKLLLVGLLGLFAWTAWPAEAGDDEKTEVAALQAELTRMNATTQHLREAYDQAMANGERATKALTALTSSLTHMRQLNAQLQVELSQLRADLAGRPDDDPARLKQELRAEQVAHAQDVTKLNEQLAELAERCNRTQVQRTIAEQRLAEVEALLKAALAGK